MTKTNIILGVLIGSIVIISAGWCYLATYKPTINNFDECVKAGYPVLLSEKDYQYCQTSDGQNFTDNTSTTDPGNSQELLMISSYADKIKIDNLPPGTVITSPLKITGQARGNWFFEASFPIVLKDIHGKELAYTVAHATKDWMSTDFVPFEATLNFTANPNTEAVLVFKKDNPSDLPASDDQLPISVIIGK